MGRQRWQGGLAYAQRQRHRLADLQRLVERQPAQAVGVEVVWRQEGLGAEQGRLRREEEEGAEGGGGRGRMAGRLGREKTEKETAERGERRGESREGGRRGWGEGRKEG